MRNELNMSFLRLVGEKPAGGEPQGVRLSRRQFLQAGGSLALAAAGMKKAASPVGQIMAGAVEVAYSPDRAALKIGGQERWVIETRLFGGSPRLSVTETEEAVRITLAGATYPGTTLPADLTADLLKARPGRMRLYLRLGRFNAEVPVGEWVQSITPATSRIRVEGWSTALGETGELRLNGAAQATFSPDWQLKLNGAGVARVTAAGVDATADTLTIAFQPADAPSLLQHPAGRRTLITLARPAGAAWPEWPALAGLRSEGLEVQSNPFRLLRIEAMETQKGVLRQGLVAETLDSAPGALAFRGSAFTQPDGSPASLALRQARLAIALDGEGDQTALFARFAEEPTWVCTQGCTLHLGDAPHAKPFELVTRDGAVQRLSAAPAVFAMATAMPGAIVEPVYATESEPIHIESVDADTPAPPRPAPTLPVITPQAIIRAPAGYINVVRSEDLLSFGIRFINMQLVTRYRQVPALVPTSADQTSYIVFKFPPQAIAERAYLDANGTSEVAGNPPIPSRASGPTWIAFRIPKTITSIDYTVESLLDWGNWDQMTVSRYTDPSANDYAPNPITAIEAPYRLVLSPSPDTYWSHAKSPVTLQGRTELWHTQLKHLRLVRVGSTFYPYNSVRAVWTPDSVGTIPPTDNSAAYNLLPFPYAMTPRDRYEIVRQSPLPWFGPGSAPIKVENLMLSSLGAWLKSEGKWDPSPASQLSVSAWRHEMVMGRDQYVKVVRKGYLYPFGHLAVLITETERRTEPVPATGHKGAYLRKRQFILVLEQEKQYPKPEDFTNANQIKRSRKMPFRKVTVVTRSTPTLDNTALAAYQVPGLGATAFWPRVNNAYFPFHFIGTDWEGKESEFASFVIWTQQDILTGTNPATIAKEYAKDMNRITSDMKGQRVAFAPRVDLPDMPTDGKPGDTIFETASISFGSKVKEATETVFPPFFPTVEQADVHIPTLKHLTGTTGPQTIAPDDNWLLNGFDPGNNPGYVFAKLPSAPSLAFGGDKSGGVMTPDMDLGGLSLSHGLVGGDTDAFGGGSFNPKKFFGDKAKVLGGLLLSDILETINVFTANGDPTVPQITSKVVFPNDDKTVPPEAIDTDLKWEPKVKDFSPLIAYYNPDPDKDKNDSGSKKTTALVTAHVHTPFKDPASADYKVHGELNNFIVDLAKCIRLGFPKLAFDVKKGQNLKTDVDLDWVVFEGPLAFVEKLRESLGKIFGNGFKLDVEPSGVRASLNIALPSVAVGVFELKNMSIGAGLDLPFTGDKPALVKFNFCTRENPFSLTVSMLGGGGFFGITLSMAGVQTLEASLEFGASISIDLGVASGGVSVKAGIYFKYETGQGSTLEGYLRINGEMSVLCIASLSITLYLAFTYKDHGKCWGQATIEVEVEVLFFSFSVSVHAERQFSGKEGDPPFSAMLTSAQWDEYTQAFAA